LLKDSSIKNDLKSRRDDKDALKKATNLVAATKDRANKLQVKVTFTEVFT